MDEQLSFKESDAGSSHPNEEPFVVLGDSDKEDDVEGFVEIGVDTSKEELSGGSKKCKKLTSTAWETFDVVVINGVKKAKCKDCNSLLSYSGANGTSHLNKHARKHCSGRHLRLASGQSQLKFKKEDDGTTSLSLKEKTKKVSFDQDVSRRELVKMVVVHEFCYVPSPHTNGVIAKILMETLSQYSLENKISSVVVDNCSTNDAMINVLLEKLESNCLVLNGEFLHMRCSAHILNLIVKDGLQVIDHAIAKVRECIAFWMSTPKRIEKFEDACRVLNVTKTKRIGLDVKTRWNSTFLMLESSLPFKDVFNKLKRLNKRLKFSVPSDRDWNMATIVCQKLEIFYKATKVFSNRNHPTANLFFRTICEIKLALRRWVEDGSNEVIKTMAMSMVDKFDKYWYEINGILAIAAILDPRNKMDCVAHYFEKLYGDEANNEMARVRRTLDKLVREFESKNDVGNGQSSPLKRGFNECGDEDDFARSKRQKYMNTRLRREQVLFDPEIERTARKTRKEFLQKQREERLYLENLFKDEEEMGDERTLKELAAPKLDDEPLGIIFPTLEKPLKLNSGFLNLLPKFYGRGGEDPNRFLKEFLVVCSSMKPEGIDPNHVKLHSFPFSLFDIAKDWLYSLPPGSITTWDALQKAFLENFFPASRIGSIRKEICGVKQHSNESLYEYWERFKRLCASCPQHQISDQLLIQYFYEGLLGNDKNMIDAASGGALVDKTPTQARQLISNMAQNARQFGSRSDVKTVNEIDLTSIKSQLQENAQQIATLTTLMSKFVGNESKAKQLDGQIGQICTSLSNLETQLAGKLPSQPLPNPKDVNALTLRSGKVLNEPKVRSKKVENELEVRPSIVLNGDNNETILPQENGVVKDNNKNRGSEINFSHVNIVPPFPSRFAKANKAALDNEILDMFRKVEINIPLIDAIKQVPRYAKFLKELCTNKRKLGPSEKVCVGENVSAVILKKKLPPKYKDPGMFAIPCRIGNSKFERCMLDLGASINVMPKSVFQTLNVGPMSKTDVVIQLADRSTVFPMGVLEDVLVQVNELVFPADFYILDMGNNSDSTPLLLGRPFLKTARTKIDVFEGTLTMEFDGEILKFNIFDAMKYPSDIDEVHFISTQDCVDWLSQECFDSLLELDEVPVEMNEYESVAALTDINEHVDCANMTLPTVVPKLIPSIVQAPQQM
ncbi:hypothetical protein BVRB_7g180720 [Beta vulgaris subsp. vulgaris]|uniref:BED-type domain-containing protein n=1 Tax=Beta vulgaris subsp. vulgaris TaxID=3555 RepID=A0A0J8B6J3_BETVV|nr:hypothetical protein BVRB_7g180720 [Beta vulgaris subsp. vulgaris]